MKLIIAGSRTINHYPHLLEALAAIPVTPTEIVSGGAQGADYLGERYAISNGIPLARFPADWDKNGRSAGPIRNRQMAEYAEGLLALWDGKSRGTKHMIEEMQRRKKSYWIWTVRL